MPEWNVLFEQEIYRWRKPHEQVVDFADRLAGQPGARILDLGCGAGRHLVYLTGRGFCVMGMDAAPKGLAFSRQWLREEGRFAPLVQADMTALPYAEASFDALIAVHVIHHNRMAAIRRTLADMQRVLRPGGWAYFTVPSTRGYRCGQGEELEYHTVVPKTGPDGDIPHHYFDLEELVHELPGWVIWQVALDEHINEEGYRSSHWNVLAKKMDQGDERCVTNEL